MQIKVRASWWPHVSSSEFGESHDEATALFDRHDEPILLKDESFIGNNLDGWQ